MLRLLVRPVLRRIRNLDSVRRRLERLDWRGPFRHGLQESVGGVPVRIVGCRDSERVILYLHGGGFFMQASGMHLRFLKNLSEKLGARGVLPAYRLVPEHPFPSGLDDCYSVYCALLESGVNPAAITLAGESAGGTLTLALLLRLGSQGLPLPACAVTISAATDLAGVGKHASYAENRSRDAMVPLESLGRIVDAYAGGHDLTNPEISPLYGDLSGLPPLYVIASDSEVLRDDNRLLFERALAAGSPVELSLWAGLTHAFPLLGGFPEAQVARADIFKFIDRHVDTTKNPTSSLNMDVCKS